MMVQIIGTPRKLSKTLAAANKLMPMSISAKQPDECEKSPGGRAVASFHELRKRLHTRSEMEGVKMSASRIRVKHAIHSKSPMTIPSCAPPAASPTRWMVEMLEVNTAAPTVNQFSE